MDIQLINFSGVNEYNFAVDDIFKFDEVLSPGMYDLNIIDLRDHNIWKKDDYRFEYYEINVHREFESLKRMIVNSTNTNFLFILPQNIIFRENYLGVPYDDNSRDYEYATRLKDMITNLETILSSLLPIGISLYYEKTVTLINSERIDADFNLDISNNDKLVVSYKSDKVTAYSWLPYIITSLDLNNNTQLNSFLKEFDLIETFNVEVPEWFEDIEMFDDSIQKEKISNSQKLIEENQTIIINSNNKLKLNDEFKSVLYTNGDKLAEVVIQILEKLLDKKLDNFIDEKKEDFLFDLDDIYFIGEIKGVNSNIKASNLAQLEHHYLEYVEKHDVDPEKFYKLLIMNHQRNQPPNNRQEVHPDHIRDAKVKYEILIIETFQLLKLLELKINGKIDTSECVNLFQEKGIMKMEKTQ